jgi:lambda repressor-like predicted transcriptional regulator
MQTPFTHHDIQYHLRKRGITQKQLAAEQEVSDMAISYVIRGKLISRRLMVAIADAIEMPPEDVFHWYFVEKQTVTPSKVA